VTELIATCGALAADESVRGVLLASAHPKLFCPGLDLVSLYAYERPALEALPGLDSRRRSTRSTRWRSRWWPRSRATRSPAAALLALDRRPAAAAAGRADRAQRGQGRRAAAVAVALLLRARVGPAALARVALLGRNFADEAAVAAGLADAVLERTASRRAARAARGVPRQDARSVALTKRYLRRAPLRGDAGPRTRAGGRMAGRLVLARHPRADPQDRREPGALGAATWRAGSRQPARAAIPSSAPSNPSAPVTRSTSARTAAHCRPSAAPAAISSAYQIAEARRGPERPQRREPGDAGERGDRGAHRRRSDSRRSRAARGARMRRAAP